MILAIHGIYMDNLTAGCSSKRTSFYSKLLEFQDIDFLNENLSIGGVIVKEANDQILNYLGNTVHGSSGGLIIDQDLNILGINFGFFNDEVDTQ